jgi:Zn-dependent M16 (insulinase) family peptidase
MANREKLNEIRKEYYQKNKEKILERGKKYRAENPEKVKAYFRWRAEKLRKQAPKTAVKKSNWKAEKRKLEMELNERLTMAQFEAFQKLKLKERAYNSLLGE